MRRLIDLDEVIEWHKDNLSGMTLKEVGVKYNRDHTSIKNWFEKYNISYIRFKSDNPSLIMPAYMDYMNNLDKPLNKVAKEYNLDVASLKRGMKYFGLPQKEEKNYWSSFHPNHNFFSCIDSEIKAYILGLFASDGHVEDISKGRYALKFSWHEKDRYLIDLVNEHLGNSKYNVRKIPGSNQLAFGLKSKQMALDLLSLGFTNRKTYEGNFPNIPEHLIPHYIRGYFDGDGCIMTGPLKAGGSYATFGISGYSQEALEIMFNYIPHSKLVYKRFSSSQILNKGNEGTGWSYTIGHRDSIRDIHSYLYSQANFYLKRKKDKFDLAIQYH